MGHELCSEFLTQYTRSSFRQPVARADDKEDENENY